MPTKPLDEKQASLPQVATGATTLERVEATTSIVGYPVLPQSIWEKRIGYLLAGGIIAALTAWVVLALTGNSLTLSSTGEYVFQYGPVSLKWYGFFLVVGFLAATISGFSRGRHSTELMSDLMDAAMCGLVGGMIGARFYYVLISLPYYIQHPGEILAFDTGGLTIHGCIMGVVAGLFVYCRVKKVSFLFHLDHMACILPLAQGIWRWGNFFNSEAYGAPVNNYPVQVYIAEAYRPDSLINQAFYHPTFLYEACWNLGIFVFLFFFLSPRVSHSKPGIIACTYLLLYSIGRILIEPLRLDGIALNGVNVPLVASGASVVVALLGMVVLNRRYAKRAAAAAAR